MRPVNDPNEGPPDLPEEAAAWLVERRANLIPALEAAGGYESPVAELQALIAVMLEADHDSHRALVRALCSLYVLELELEAADARIQKLEAQMATLKPNWRADA